MSESTFAKAALYSAAVFKILGFMRIPSDGGSVDFVIPGMGSDKADENDASVVVDFNDESVGVAFDVKNDPVAGKDVRTGVVFFDILRSTPICRLGFMEPRFERGLGAGVFFIKIPECFARDNSHLNLRRLAGRAS
jgi:hypothetical protein